MGRLRRSDWREPGITRRRRGSGFEYVDRRGQRVTDPDTLSRVKSLAIPPAWTEVWVCKHPFGHLQAVGIDDAGRRQYIYHEKWRAQRDDQKHRVAQVLGLRLPQVRRQSSAALKARGLTRDRVLATAVRLLDLGLFRVGSERYASENDSFGLATLKRDHVTASRAGMRFEYPAKSGQTSEFVITEPLVCSSVRQLLARRDPSPELLGWWDAEQRSWVDLKSVHINEHLKTLVRDQTSAKDFRTWHGTVLMAVHLSDAVRDGEKLSRRLLTDLYREVARELGNTAAIARNSYVNPQVVDLAEHGCVIKGTRRQKHELISTSASNAVLAMLRAESG